MFYLNEWRDIPELRDNGLNMVSHSFCGCPAVLTLLPHTVGILDALREFDLDTFGLPDCSWLDIVHQLYRKFENYAGNELVRYANIRGYKFATNRFSLYQFIDEKGIDAVDLSLLIGFNIKYSLLN